MITKFDSIRPFDDSDLPAVLDRLLNNRQLMASLLSFRFSSWPKLLHPLLGWLTKKYVLKQSENIRSLRDFQVLVEPYVQRMIDKTTDKFTISGLEQVDLAPPCLFISNHRDIALDPAFVNWALHLNGQDTVRIAVGDNLLSEAWITDLIRLNKCFIVNRSAKDRRQKLADAKLLSEYIFHTLKSDDQHIWIAQREGRAKDGRDVTNPAIISMLSLNKPKETEFSAYIRQLRIVPVSISYEFDPCDISKANELHETELTGSYDKEDSEDSRSIINGMTGYKGQVHVHFGEVLDGEFFSAKEVADHLDKQILAGYRPFASAVVAAKILGLTECAANQDFSAREIAAAEAYLTKRTENLAPAVASKLLQMYAMPLKLNKT
ncbi:MAG: 1-acyl-sn-glycerol-3-phosphate acyltransferase [Paraglaciecola sp.]|jgi:1-acyl-sn-glycerol-3-phosphate acyltransferase